MKIATLTIILTTLNFFSYSQSVYPNYNPKRITKYKGEVKVKNKLALLYKAIETSEIDSDSGIMSLKDAITCYQEVYSKKGDPERVKRPITDFIHIVDLNNDKQNDIIVDAFYWGCSILHTYIFMNDSGNYKLALKEIGYPVKFTYNNKKVDTCTIYKPGILYLPNFSDFCCFYKYVYADTTYNICEKFSVFENLLPLIKNKKSSPATTYKTKVALYYSDDNGLKEKSSFNVIEVIDKNYNILQTKNDWKLVIVKGIWLKGTTGPDNRTINNYYCGWTNEL